MVIENQQIMSKNLLLIIPKITCY